MKLTMEHSDIKSTFLHEQYKLPQRLYVREMARSNWTYKHGGTIGLLKLNLYGNPAGTYYRVDYLLQFLKKKVLR